MKRLSLFAKKYLPENPRSYTFRDFEPEIAIIRFDDTEWGQGKNVYCDVDYDNKDDHKKIRLYWKDWLFGGL